MKKDIPFLPVEGVSIAITRQLNEMNEQSWNVFLINRNPFTLKDIVIRSQGYGTLEGETQKTSTLRYHISSVGPGEHTLIEPIAPEVFHLYNEYWISYFVGIQIFDKKFIFVPESIIEDNLIYIPQLDQEGILHS